MDVNANAFRIVRALTEQNEQKPRVRAARKAGTAGGAARAESLSAERKREIAVRAAEARWKKRA